MSIRMLGVLAVSIGLVAAIAPSASAQLTLPQVTAITRCQDALNREGRSLVAKAQSALEGCASAKLTPVLKDDNGLITPERFDIDNDRATTTWAAFAALGKIPRGAEIIEVDPDISPADIDPRCDF